ncbi:MAG: protein TonB [Hyphococcus sp.]|nr:MAG: protein TonB [Marinicaulis sp.]
MGAFIRFILSAPFAALITLLIFLGLYNQISPNPFLYTKAEEPGVVYLGDQILCECYPDEGRLIQLPEKPDTPNSWTNSEKVAKQPPTLPTGCDENCAEIIIELDIPVPSKKEEGPGRLKYPQACLEKNLEGVVIVGFDITPEGRPTNIKIVQSPDNCFHQAALEMVSRWRYPIEVNAQGKPVWRYDQTTRIRFQLNK